MNKFDHYDYRQMMQERDAARRAENAAPRPRKLSRQAKDDLQRDRDRRWQLPFLVQMIVNGAGIAAAAWVLAWIWSVPPQ